MAGSKSAAIEQLDDKEIYHLQARAGNRIKQVMAGIHMEIQGLDQRRKQLERQYSQLEEALELQKFSPLNIGRRELPEIKPKEPHLGLCCETAGIEMPGVSDMRFDLAEQDKFFGADATTAFLNAAESAVMGKGLHIDQWPESSINQPVEVKEADGLPVFQLASSDKFNPETMRGTDWFDYLNFGCSFPESTEGYWRRSAQKPESEAHEKLPWPVVRDIPGYDKEDFVKRLLDVEQISTTEKKVYRGLTAHRWTGKTLGNAEFWCGAFRWPDSYNLYLAAGVPPSKHFFRFIMMEHAEIFPQHPTLSTVEFNSVFHWLPSYRN